MKNNTPIDAVIPNPLAAAAFDRTFRELVIKCLLVRILTSPVNTWGNHCVFHQTTKISTAKRMFQYTHTRPANQ